MRSSLIDSQRVSDENEPNRQKQSGFVPNLRPVTSSQKPQSLHFTQLNSNSEQGSTVMPQEGWFPLILLAIALYCVVIVIVNAKWVSHSEFFYIFPIAGLLVGFLVAKISILPQVLLHVLACFVGYILAEWSCMTAFQTSWMVVVGGLKGVFTGQMGFESAGSNAIVFFFYLAFLCFFLGYFGSWLIYRARLPWLVALVYISIMLVNLNYVKSDLNILLIFMLGILILLIARVQLSTQLLQWTSEGLYTDKTWLRKITRRCMQVACGITLVVVLLSWFLPVQTQPASGKVLWDNINTAWNSSLGGKFPWTNGSSLLFSSTDSTNFFGDKLTISNSVHLPGGEVLSYKSSDGKSHDLENATFDSFNGNTWTVSGIDISAKDYSANAQLPIDVASSSGTNIDTDVTMVQSLSGSKNYVFAPAQPVSFSVPTQIFSNGKQDISSATAWTEMNALTANSEYQVSSRLVSTTALTNVPLPDDNGIYWQQNAYSALFARSYLQKPSDLSPNVEKTALSWTSGTNNAYDALKSIEAHLTDTKVFKYSVDNKAIPANTDVVDWLLKTRVGYCTYYASTMAMMGRILNIPTRLVTGFSSGTYDPVQKVWSVQGSDAHSWVQAYFPGYGWIDFDPTPGFSTASVAAASAAPTSVPTSHAVNPTATPKVQATSTANAHNTSVDPQTQSQQQGFSPLMISLWSVFGFLLLCFLLFVAILVRQRKKRQNTSRSMVSGIYWRACRIAGWVGLGPRSWQTPYEYTQMLSRHWPSEEATLWHLTDLFVRERWGGASSPQEQEIALLEHSRSSLQKIFWHLLFRRRKK